MIVQELVTRIHYRAVPYFGKHWIVEEVGYFDDILVARGRLLAVCTTQEAAEAVVRLLEL